MLIAILITVIIVAALAGALGSERERGMIGHHRYNNVHSDASAARQDHLG